MVERAQTRGEEIANSISHGVSLLAAVVAMPILIVVSAQQGTAINIVGATVFAASMLLLYGASTLYHAIAHPGAKRVFRKLDHGAIYLLIAGTYTPFVLVPLRGPWGWSLFGVIWGLAVLGIAVESVSGGSRKIARIVIYLAMGWLVIVAARPLVQKLPSAATAWLAAGGLFYSGGVVFYAADKRFKHAHGMWHIFVMAGSVAHYVAILLYVAPPT